MLTETEARKKWCPYARVVFLSPTGDSYSAYNRLVDPEKIEMPESARCIASDCMAWRRWGFMDNSGAYDRDHTQLTGACKGVGYCGLAGDPSPRCRTLADL